MDYYRKCNVNERECWIKFFKKGIGKVQSELIITLYRSLTASKNSYKAI